VQIDIDNENMLANQKKQDLEEHLIAVSHLACAMAKDLGLSDKLCECALCAGLLHDIGKATSPFQKYIQGFVGDILPDDTDPTQEFGNVPNAPLHHEISWAFLAGQISNQGNSILLSAIYWHHARPLNEAYEHFKTHDEILSETKGISAVKKLFDKLKRDRSLHLAEYEPDASVPVPDFFVPDGTLDRSTNAELLAVRGCLISADRYISALSADEVHRISGDQSICQDILAKLSGNGAGNYSRPEKYDLGRFKLQESCAFEAQKEHTVLIKAPAGFGKTITGLIWSSGIGGRLVWVCPRNVVAESVYQSVCMELEAMKMTCTIELYLTGERQKCNFSQEVPDFASDIVVTNIDNLLAPMVSNRIAHRLFSVVGSTMVLDEFHELISDSPLFASFITFMRARHRLSTTAKTLLLSATPTNVSTLWDTQDLQTKFLPGREVHYPAAHKGNYALEFLPTIPSTLSGGSLTICNSIKNTQNTYRNTHATIIAHSAYTDEDRCKITEDILTRFGKNGKGIENGDTVVSAPIIQAAMDISFKELTECMLSPETTLQRIGRCDRWGNLNASGKTPMIRFVDLAGDASEDGAVRTMYDSKLHRKWVGFLTDALKTVSRATLDELYLVYNRFYSAWHKEIYAYIRDSYKQGLELLVDRYAPVKLKIPRDERDGSGRSLRSPFGSYFYTVKTSAGKWLGPEQVLSEGLELWFRYTDNGERTSRLCDAGAMRPIIRELGDAGYKPYIRIAKRNRIPDNLIKWFKLARNRATPLPDVSRIYDVSYSGQSVTGTGLGLMENNYQ
jgi:CRISPR-associated endonuclease/helicase Cas3